MWIRHGARAWARNGCISTNTARVTRRNGIPSQRCSPAHTSTRSFTDETPSSKGTASGELGLADLDDRNLTRLLHVASPGDPSRKKPSSSRIYPFVTLTYRNAAQNGRQEPRPDQILQQLGNSISDAPASLSDYSAASNAVARHYPQISGWVGWNISLGADLLDLGYGTEARVTAKCWFDELRIDISQLQIKQETSKNHVAAPLAKVKLFARLRTPSADRPSMDRESSGPAFRDTGSAAIEDEAKRLAQRSASVLQTVWDELLFDSYEAASQAMAEALARVIEFADPELIMYGVHLHLCPRKSADIESTTAQVFTNSAEDVFRTKRYSSNAKQPVGDAALCEKTCATEQDGSDVKTNSKGEFLLQEKTQASKTLEKSLGLDQSTFSIKWSGLQAKTKPTLSINDIRKSLEDRLLSCQSQGSSCFHTAWKVLTEIEPSPTEIALCVNGPLPVEPISKQADSSNAGRLSVLLKSTPRNPAPKVMITLSRLFVARFDRHSSSTSFTLDLKGLQSCSEQVVSLKELFQAVAATVRLAIEGRSFADHEDLTRTVADSLQVHDEGIASILSLDDVGVAVKWRSGSHHTLWLSQVQAKPADEIQTAQSVARQPQSTAAGAQLKESKGVTSEGNGPTLIALGSNVGDRLASIEDACRALDAEPDIRVVRSSSLYETKAMYVEDQAPFLNAVCEIETSLKPEELLDRTQAIEQGLGRVKTIDKGPRNIDLDILLHGDNVVDTDRLKIPHALMHERDFVLQPMSDVVRMKEIKHPTTRRNFYDYLKKLKDPGLHAYPLTSLGEGCPEISPLHRTRATRVMSILNVTPDSFSDGGDHGTKDLESLIELVRSHIANGASIIDIGGQSSRPNAPDVTAEEEISRVVPVIQAIKSLPEAVGVAISVDTYRAPVAEAAIKAGAHIINDISAGLLDDDMLPTIARLGCTYIMMHMRGNPATMMSEEHCSYPDGLIRTIRHELAERVDAAQAVGIRRWRMILDPGVGFSKTVEQNLTILRRMNRLYQTDDDRLYRMPWLVGTSRKSFIGKITGVEEPKERSWGTAATVTEAVRKGADIVRVHDVAEMAKVVKMADAMFRV